VVFCLSRRLAAVFSVATLLSAPVFITTGAFAQTVLVVTPSRSEQPLARAGSAVSVISREEIERSASRNLSDLLRTVPGLSVSGNGGFAQTQTLRLRGSEARHTLVLVDGIRINDPSSTGRELDLSTLVLTDIERIEVLRGPQSALYGSDAIGGVVNLIMRKDKKGFSGHLSAEYGRYNTREIKGSISGGDGRSWLSLSAAGIASDGFSAYGARIKRLERKNGGPFEQDFARRFGLAVRAGTKLGEDVTLEAGGDVSRNRAGFDSAFGNFPDTESQSASWLLNGYARAKASLLDGAWRNTLTVFGTEGKRRFDTVDIFDFFGPPETFRSRYDYRSQTRGAEYQGDIRLPDFGLLTLGAKWEEEGAKTLSSDQEPFPRSRSLDLTASQVTRSLFALHQFSLGERLHLSFGARLDAVENSERFATWRTTLAYELFETGTKLRLSLGTGAKAPSLFQRFSPLYGTLSLSPEHSFGADIGIDQSWQEGRLTASATVFFNRYRDLISFGTHPACTPLQSFGCYFNTDRAKSSGLELAFSAELIPTMLRLNGTYTFLEAQDRISRQPLPRRPEHEGKIAFTLTPLAQLSISPAVVFVGQRFDDLNASGKLAPYARVDLDLDWRASSSLTFFARARNLTDTRYEEVRNYGTEGRAFYGGLRATW
jgi:vitamin B12 transporter